MRRAPWPSVGGSKIRARPLRASMRAMWLPASEAYQTPPARVVAIPYGPGPPGASNKRIRPDAGSSRPYTPDWPVNHSRPRRSNVAVLRFAPARSPGNGNRRTRSERASTRTIAFSPPSVTHAARSGPTITPCGAEPDPSGTRLTRPVRGSRRPSSPAAWAVNQTLPLAVGATS
jgi:hypothetical protein